MEHFFNIELMEHIGLIISAGSLFLTLILFFVGRLVFLQDRAYQAQKKFNDKLYCMLEKNAEEHAQIQTRLEKGIIWFDENKTSIKENHDNIDKHEERLNNHDLQFVSLNKDVKTLYKKVEW